MIKVLIVDDHAVVRRGLKEILTDEPDITVSEAEDAETAAELVRTDAWDLIILDLDLPGKSGLQFLEELKQNSNHPPVLVLSVYSEDQFALRTLWAGAAGFVSKDAAPTELVAAIRTILSGRKHITPGVAEMLLVRKSPEDNPLHEKLSDREFQIL